MRKSTQYVLKINPKRIKLAEEIHTKNDHSCKENGNKLNKSK